MTQNNKHIPPNDIQPGLPQMYEQPDDEINLIDLVYPIYKHRLFLVLFCIFVTFIVAIVTFNMPKTYEASITFLPEESDSGVGSELKAAYLQQFGISGLGGGGAVYISIPALVQSKELNQMVRKRYNFNITGAGVVYSVTSEEKEGTSITAQANDPIAVADIANTYMMEIDKFNRTNTVTSAQRLRKYVEKRLESANEELNAVQQELRDFQEMNKAISISKQAEATLQVLSEMEAQRVGLEVEKAAKEKFYARPHIEIEQLNAQMQAIQKNIDRLTYSREEKIKLKDREGKVDFYIPLNRIPALNFEESKLLIKVKAKTRVIIMLTTQLEQAKLDETKDMPTINVLDWAKPKWGPIKPNLRSNVMLSFLISFFVGSFIIFIIEYFQKMDQNDETSKKWNEIKSGILKSIPLILKHKSNL